MSVRVRMVAGLAGTVLALAAAGAASASTTGGSPSPSGDHHQRHHHTRTVCFYSLETETDGLNGQPVSQGDHGQQGQQGQGQQGGKGGAPVNAPAATPSASTPAPSATTPGDQGPGPQGDHAKGAEEIEVVQLVRACVTTERGDVVNVQAWDVSGPFAWAFNAQDQQGPGGHAPGQLPGQIRGLLIQH